MDTRAHDQTTEPVACFLKKTEKDSQNFDEINGHDHTILESREISATDPTTTNTRLLVLDIRLDRWTEPSLLKKKPKSKKTKNINLDKKSKLYIYDVSETLVRKFADPSWKLLRFSKENFLTFPLAFFTFPFIYLFILLFATYPIQLISFHSTLASILDRALFGC